jgi:8-oxo-dGTP diphosphatase
MVRDTSKGGQVTDTPKDQAEAAFLAQYDPSTFERPSVSVDVALISAHEGALHALLVRREQWPFKDMWSLPGGFVGLEEGLDEAAERVLRTKTGLNDVFLEQLYSFGDLGRDPRMRIITVAYYALVDYARFERVRGAAIQESRLVVPWAGETGGDIDVLGPEGAPRPLAFDHPKILGLAVQRIRGKLNYAPIGYELLPTEFPLRALQAVHETILGRSLNKDSFRRRMLATGELEATGKRETAVGHRPAELYRVIPRKDL